MFEVLGATGVRRSELLALEGRHLALDGDRPHIKVRQRVRRRRGAGLVVGPLKSRYARRDIPIPVDLADRLRALNVADDELVFTSTVGTILDPDNLSEQVLAPACSEAGVEWAGSTHFATQSPPACSPRGATPYRSNGGSGTTRPRSRSRPTCTCSTAISASR
jgi:integrase